MRKAVAERLKACSFVFDHLCEMTAFEEFGVMPELGAAVDEMGWTLPTDVQVLLNWLIEKQAKHGNVQPSNGGRVVCLEQSLF